MEILQKCCSIRQSSCSLNTFFLTLEGVTAIHHRHAILLGLVLLPFFVQQTPRKLKRQGPVAEDHLREWFSWKGYSSTT